MKIPPAPKGLSKETQKLWRDLLTEMGKWEDSQLMLLSTLVVHFDKMEAARKAVDKEGLTVLDRFGQTKPHPLLHTICEHSGRFQSAYKLLGLDFMEADE
jgi:P27 family predicted phage terminase small subunit